MDQDILINYRNIFEKDLLEEIASIGKRVSVKAEETILESGQYIKFIPLILSGTLKVLRIDDDGGEILLYYVRGNETCAMSLTCCLAHQKSSIRVVAEEDVEMITLPVAKMEDWMLQYTSWKNFVMLTYSARFDELLKTIDSIAFHKVDERLEKYLKDKSALYNDTIISVSHQKIAEELNSSREVISRLLKQLEHNGKIRLGRNKIELVAAF